MDIDRELGEAEREASPGLVGPPYRAISTSSTAAPHATTVPAPTHHRDSNEIERIPSHASVSTSASSAALDRSSARRRSAAVPSPDAHAASASAPGATTAKSRDSLATDDGAADLVMSRVSTQADLERHPTELSRIATYRSQHNQTVGRVLSARESRKPLPAFGAGKAYPPPLPEREEYVVEFDGPDDPIHAQNWPMRKKLITASMLAWTTLTASFASSVFSPAVAGISAQFAVSSEVSLLGVSLYVLGFAFGPSLWAPLSELKGRRLPIVVAMLGFTAFSAGCASAKDIQTILICRFFSGLCGACPLAVVAAVFSDLFDNRMRGIALAVFSMTVFSGPFLAGPIGGYMVDSYLGWRWTEWLVTIMGGVAFAIDVLFLEETYPPVILVAKASELRRRTLNWGIHARQEEIEVDFGELVKKNFTRPLRMLFLEPIVLALSIYTAFIYGLLYLFLTAYPLAFQSVHGFSAGQSGLTFFGMILGQIIAGGSVIAQQPWYNRKLAANGGVPVPEWRLPNVIAGGVAFAIGIFWFGWSAYRPDVHWMVPTASGVFTGFGLMSIFLQAINYLVDAYLLFAASVLAGNTFIRSLFGAGFPLFARQMFQNMGIQWAATLLGCIAIVLVPIPILFYKYGARMRQRSVFAPTGPPRPTVNEDEDAIVGEEKESGKIRSKQNSNSNSHSGNNNAGGGGEYGEEDLANLASVPRSAAAARDDRA